MSQLLSLHDCHILLFFICFLSFDIVLCQKSVIFNRIFASYDADQRPLFNTSQPVIIDVQYRINLLYGVSSKDETYNFDLFVREQWLDERLTYDPVLWPKELGPLRIPLTRTWKPDTFFYNAISCTPQDQLLTLSYTGQLIWTRHLTCLFHSDFNLLNFPFDSQIFTLRRLSFAYNVNELILRQSIPCFNPDPLITFENSLWNLNNIKCDVNYFSFKNAQAPYSQIIGDLTVERKSQNYIIKMILPMFVIVFLSTLTYWIDANSPPARVSGTVTLVLTIVTFNLTVSADLPKINYSTLLDWYVWKCFLFVFFGVLEFAFVHHIMVSKVVNVKIAQLTDDFCAYTITGLWILSNLLYWPIINNLGLKIFIGIIEIIFFVLNVARVFWNYKYDQKGLAVLKPLKQKLLLLIKSSIN